MAEKKQEWVSKAQLKIWAILVAVGIIGLALVTAPDSPWPWLDSISKQIGSALVTTSALGLTVDTFFKREFARDVFIAAFRYVLRDELKEEVRRIIEYKLLCTKHEVIIKITPLSDGFVRVRMSTERTIENISREAQPIQNKFQVDEWAVPGHPSKVEKCTMKAGTEMDSTQIIEDRVDRIGRMTEEILLKRGDTATLVSQGYEIHRDNGQLLMMFNSPTVNPVTIVEVSEGFKFICEFGVPNEKVTASQIYNKFELQGTLFPGQKTRIRWWPANTGSDEEHGRN